MLQVVVEKCPFCGALAQVENDFGKSFWVQCENDHSDGVVYDSFIEALTSWNTRS